MFCSKCGKKLADGVKLCPSCGVESSEGSSSGVAPVVVVKEKGGCLGKGCLIAVILMAIIGVALIVIIGGVASEVEKEENDSIVASSAVSMKDAIRNGEDLVAWIRNKNGQTDLARDDAFARLKGKTVLLRGKVREIGKTAISDEVFVSLTVGQLDMLERINVQFNLRASIADKVKSWNKDEMHTMRGRIKDQGDLCDDAICDIAEIVE